MKQYVLVMKYKDGLSRILDAKFSALEAKKMVNVLNLKKEIIAQGEVQMMPIVSLLSNPIAEPIVLGEL